MDPPPPPLLPPPRPPRVLSIQSSVVHGVVGLAASTLPLQLAGWEVCPLATVAFSNHSAYPHRGGAALSADGLRDLLSGLAANGVGLESPGAFDAVLTGYVGRAETVTALGEALAAAKRASGGSGSSQPRPFRLVVDPVAGDGGALYVPPDVPAAYLPLLRLADVILPNATEAAALLAAAGTPLQGGDATIATEAGALAALTGLHALGPPVVVLTSAAVDEWPGDLVLYASVVEQEAEGEADGGAQPSPGTRTLRLRVRAHPRSFTGTGDLLAALVTSRLGRPCTRLTAQTVAAALEGAVARVQAVLARTAAAADAAAPALAAAGVPAGPAGARHPAALAASELRLVESVGDLASPPPGPKAEWI
jgi:pyridoxine kinase